MQKFSFIYEGRVYNFKEQHLKNIVYSETKKLVSETYKPKFEALDKRYGNLLNESKYKIVYNLKREKLQEAFMDTVKNLAGKAWSAIKTGAGKIGGFFKQLLNKPTVEGMHLAGAKIGRGIGAILASPIAIGHGIASAFKDLSVLDAQKQQLVKAEIPKIVDEMSKTKDEASTEAVLNKKEEELKKTGLSPEESKKIIDHVRTEVSRVVIAKAAELSAKTAGGNLSGNLEAALNSPKYQLGDAEKNWIATNVLAPMKKAPSAQKVFLLEVETAAVEPTAAPAAVPKAAPAASVAKPTPATPTAKSSAKPATRLSVELSKKLIADTTLQPLQKTKIKNFLSAWVKTQKGTVEDRFSRALFDAGIGVKVKTSQNDYEIDSEEPINTATAPAVSAGEAPAASTTAKPPPPPPPADADETEEPATAGTEPAPATTASTPDAKVGEAIKGVKKQYNKATDENTRQVIDQVADAVQKALAGKFNAEAGQVVNLTEEQVDVQISGIIMDVLNKSNLNNSAKQALYKQIYITLKNNRNIGYQTSGLRHNYATRNARPAATDTAKAPTAPAPVKTQAVKPNLIRSQLEESKQLYTKKGNMFVLNG